MTTRLLLVRHGDSHHKADGILTGPSTCRGLTDLGRRQAGALRDRLARDSGFTPPGHVYSSVLPRAIETAQILAEAFGHAAVRQDCGLCTWHTPPDLEGMTWTAYRAEHGRSDGGVFRPFEQGNETWAELVARTGQALSSIVQRHRNETTVVVAHTETVNASLVVFGHLPLLLPFAVAVAHTSVTEWATDEDPTAWPPAQWTLCRLNDTAHLRE